MQGCFLFQLVKRTSELRKSLDAGELPSRHENTSTSALFQAPSCRAVRINKCDGSSASNGLRELRPCFRAFLFPFGASGTFPHAFGTGRSASQIQSARSFLIAPITEEAVGRQGEEEVHREAAAGQLVHSAAAALPSVAGLLAVEAPLSAEDPLSVGEPLSVEDGHSRTGRSSRQTLPRAALLRRRTAGLVSTPSLLSLVAP